MERRCIPIVGAEQTTALRLREASMRLRQEQRLWKTLWRLGMLSMPFAMLGSVLLGLVDFHPSASVKVDCLQFLVAN